MKLVVAADLHGDYHVWQEILNLLNKEDELAIAGDLLGDRYPPVNNSSFLPDIIAQEFRQLENKKYLVKGNCDLDIYLKDLPLFQIFELFGKNIFLTHGNRSEFFVENLSSSYQIDLYISGHSHRALLRSIDSLTMLNPGSAAEPREQNRTVAMLYPDVITIYDLDRNKQTSRLSW